MAELADGPLALLFSDVEGSTDLRTERGDATAHRILRSYEKVVRRCVADGLGGRDDVPGRMLPHWMFEGEPQTAAAAAAEVAYAAFPAMVAWPQSNRSIPRQ